MGCQIFIGSLQRHLAAISASDRRRGRPVDKIYNFLEKKTFSKLLVRPFQRVRPGLRARLTKAIFNILPPMWWGPPGPEVQNIKSESIFLVFLISCFLKHRGDLR